MKKILIALFFISLPFVSFADTASDNSAVMTGLYQQISQLEAMIKNLQVKINDLSANRQSIFNPANFPGYSGSNGSGASLASNSYCVAIKNAQAASLNGTGSVSELQAAINAALAAGVNCGEIVTGGSTTNGSNGVINNYCADIDTILNKILSGDTTVNITDLQKAINAASVAGVNCANGQSAAVAGSGNSLCAVINTIKGQLLSGSGNVTVADLQKAINDALAAGVQCNISNGVLFENKPNPVRSLACNVDSDCASGFYCGQLNSYSSCNYGSDGKYTCVQGNKMCLPIKSSSSGSAAGTGGSTISQQAEPINPTIGNAPAGGMGLGSQGSNVTMLQTQLQQAGYFPSNVVPTGYYGSLTQQAVKDFQAANNLPTTGYYGPLTSGAMRTYPMVKIR